ncbi:C40 family peptidase [Sphingoaurantiacus capsulatus]|uniref:C40 family peptidase n=1 Tax=Sphingoaurantiacus capsulatus TaxID=1771310 RepID=A0ABV7X9S3_9SPHN
MAVAGDYAAAAYAQPQKMSCIASRAMVREAPRVDAGAGSELLRGEPFLAMEVGGEWAWGYCGADRYVGYVPAAAIGAATAPTHRISTPSGLIFGNADVRAAHVGELPMGSLVVATGREGAFHVTDIGFIHHRHLTPIGEAAPDWVAVAEQFVGTPYLWGGRTRSGIDCSGLVQMALGAGGIAAPRDSDMQLAALGKPVETPKRGDLAFFRGHVGIMIDETNLLHANAYWMATVIEPLELVATRSGGDQRPLIGLRRL